MSIFFALVSVAAMPICVDHIFTFRLKAKCYHILLGNPKRSAGMKENECQGCLFSDSWRVSPCGAEAPASPQGQRERLRPPVPTNLSAIVTLLLALLWFEPTPEKATVFL